MTGMYFEKMLVSNFVFVGIPCRILPGSPKATMFFGHRISWGSPQTVCSSLKQYCAACGYTQGKESYRSKGESLTFPSILFASLFTPTRVIKIKFILAK